ncbi:oxidoreductase [Catenovulum sediminis]|uniref:Oxidoreductase n=1 Tax=Catenovulum sediminis TaxID=1740262 RepID=A0ABV1RJN8_9ALTE|nr:oxidoreductase [Catenovulum sediminis]
MSYSPIKTAIVGYGFSAKTFHLPFITTLPELSLCAISSSQQQLVTTEQPQAKYFASAEAMLEQSDAELVIITAPNNVHFKLAKLALENGKHVIVEKPFVLDVADGETLVKLAKDKGLKLSVFHNRRWDGDFLTIQKLIADHKIGEIKHFEAHFDRFRPTVRDRWREQSTEGGGILFDLGPHLLDQALQLFGKPTAITAQCRSMRPNSKNVDYFNIMLHYPDFYAQLHANLYSCEPNIRFNILGSEGKYQKFGLDPQEDYLKAGIMPDKAEWADETPEMYGTVYKEGQAAEVIQTERGGYQHYFKTMADAIRLNKNEPVTAEQALENIKLIELAIKSSEQGKTLTV